MNKTSHDHFYTPIFERGGNRFVYTYPHFACASEAEAKGLGIASDLTGMSALTQSRFTGDVHRVARDDQTRIYVRGTLGGLDVSLISGPLWEQAAARAIAAVAGD